jgi:hypothetical protein
MVVQTDTAEAMQGVVRHLGGEHEIERVMDGFCRFSVVADKDAMAQAVGGLVLEIDYGRFTEAFHFDFGTDPNFFLRVKNGSLEVSRIRPE